MLHSPWHEERLLALLILVRRFQKAADEAAREHLVRLYLANTRWINNWDLVDTSAPQILGTWLLQRERPVLRRLAKSKSLWEQRIAIIATQALIRDGQFDDTLNLCQHFLPHPHDLLHKACGWMLREVGNRDAAVLKRFLDQHAAPDAAHDAALRDREAHGCRARALPARRLTPAGVAAQWPDRLLKWLVEISS